MSALVGRWARDSRRSLTWWSIALIGTVALSVALWPSIRGEERFEDLVRDLPAGVRALFGSGNESIPFTSAAGYIHSRLFGSVLPILLVVFAVGVGARALGGDEEDGRLELVLARPVSRLKVAVDRGLTAGAMVLLLVAVSVLALIATGPTVGLFDDLDLSRLPAAAVALAGLALLHGAIAFAVGAGTGRRGPALAIAGAVAAAGYLIHGLAAAGAAEALRGLSPWSWYLDRNLLAEPATLAALLLPLVLTAGAAGAGVWMFARRDLRLP